MLPCGLEPWTRMTQSAEISSSVDGTYQAVVIKTRKRSLFGSVHTTLGSGSDLNGSPSNRYVCWECENVTLLGKRVFVDVIE